MRPEYKLATMLRPADAMHAYYYCYYYYYYFDYYHTTITIITSIIITCIIARVGEPGSTMSVRKVSYSIV